MCFFFSTVDLRILAFEFADVPVLCGKSSVYLTVYNHDLIHHSQFIDLDLEGRKFIWGKIRPGEGLMGKREGYK